MRHAEGSSVSPMSQVECSCTEEADLQVARSFLYYGEIACTYLPTPH